MIERSKAQWIIFDAHILTLFKKKYIYIYG